MTLRTQTLRKLLRPNKLKDALEALLIRGAITYYRIGSLTTTIHTAKEVEISLLLTEESAPRPNPRPYIHNKNLTKKKT